MKLQLTMCAMLTLFAAGNLFSEDEIVRLQGIELKRTSDPPVVDVGRIPVGTEKVFGVPTINKTGSAFTAVEARSSCSCVIGIMPGSEVKNGESTEIRLKVKGASSRSQIKRNVHFIVRTDDGIQDYVIRVAGQVEEHISPTPERVSFSEAIHGDGFLVRLATNFDELSISTATVQLRPSEVGEVAFIERSEKFVVAKCRVDEAFIASNSSTTLFLDLRMKDEVYSIPVEIVPDPKIEIRPRSITFHRNIERRWNARVMILFPDDQSNLPTAKASQVTALVESSPSDLHKLDIKDEKRSDRLLITRIEIVDIPGKSKLPEKVRFTITDSASKRSLKFEHPCSFLSE